MGQYCSYLLSLLCENSARGQMGVCVCTCVFVGSCYETAKYQTSGL